MSVVVVGLDHTRVPLDVLERVTFGSEDLAKVLGTLRDWSNFSETVLLSTCLRTEVYAVVDRFHEAVDGIHELLATRSGLAREELEALCEVRFDDDVPRHLFVVAAGLESAVLGESEVLGQVRRAWEVAQDERASGPVLGDLFRHAVRTGKRVRTDTAIAQGTLSFSHAAVELAERYRPGGLAGTTVLLLGAGEMGRGVFRALADLPTDRRPATFVLINRTASRAEQLAATGPADVTVRVASDLAAELAEADVAVVAVSAGTHVVTEDDLGGVTNSLLVVDLGVPRNVAPAVGRRPGIEVLDLDSLRAAVASATLARSGEIGEARLIVDDEAGRYREAARERGAAPVVAALRARLDELRIAELERRRRELSEDEWEQVDGATRVILAKLVHTPITVVKQSAGSARGERLAEALRLLFDL